MGRPLRARSVDFAAIETGALFRVAQKVVSGGDFLELLLGLLVPGIEVRMQLLGKPPVGLPDFILGGGFLDSQRYIGIHGQKGLPPW